MKHDLKEFEFRRCSQADFDSLLQIQNEAFLTLQDNRLLRKNTPEMLYKCLCSPNVTMGAFYGNTLAGFSVLYFLNGSESLSRYLTCEETRNLKSANYKLCIVRDEYRGNGLQLRLGEMLIYCAKNSGVELLCATVSPDNPYSIKNIEKMGFVYDTKLVMEKYGGLERRLYYKILI